MTLGPKKPCGSHFELMDGPSGPTLERRIISSYLAPPLPTTPPSITIYYPQACDFHKFPFLSSYGPDGFSGPMALVHSRSLHFARPRTMVHAKGKEQKNIFSFFKMMVRYFHDGRYVHAFSICFFL